MSDYRLEEPIPEEDPTVQELIRRVEELLKPLSPEELGNLGIAARPPVLILDANKYRMARRLWRSLLDFADEEDGKAVGGAGDLNPVAGV